MSKHTEGEWGMEFSPANNAWEIGPIVKEGQEIPCFGGDCEIPAGEIDWSREVCITADANEANARLICAAPKMLAALQFVLYNHHEGYGEFEDIVIAAIEAATGEKTPK